MDKEGFYCHFQFRFRYFVSAGSGKGMRLLGRGRGSAGMAMLKFAALESHKEENCSVHLVIRDGILG